MLRRWYLEQRSVPASDPGSDREVYQWILGEGSRVIAENMKRVAEAAAVRQIGRYTCSSFNNYKNISV